MISMEEDGLLELISSLIKIPSVSYSRELWDIGSFISDWFKENGISAKTIKINDSPMVIASVGKGKRRIMLNGHMDVVPEGSRKKWRCDPFSGKRHNGRIYGRGSSDMKAGLGVLMNATKELADRIDYRIDFVAVPDEEVEGKGSLYLSERYKPDAVFLAEPSNSELIGIGEKGILQLSLIAKGRSVHSSLASKGENAIMKMSETLSNVSKVSEIKTEVPKGLEEAMETSLQIYGKDAGRITFNAAMISGGERANVVPAECKATVDMRIPPGTTSDKVLSWIGKNSDGCDIIKEDESDPTYTSQDNIYVKSLIESARRFAKGARPYIILGATDGRFFRERGIPAIKFGPGRLEEAHTANESVSEKEIIVADKIYMDFLTGLNKTPFA